MSFTRIHCDYFLKTQRAKLLNLRMLKTGTIVCRGAPSPTLLNLLPSLSFAHFTKALFHHSVLLFVFSFFLSTSNSSIYSPSTISKRDAIVTEKTTSRLNKLLLGNLRTNRGRVILPSSRSKIKKKNTVFIDQSAFSNFALYVITSRLTSMHTAPWVVSIQII